MSGEELACEASGGQAATLDTHGDPLEAPASVRRAVAGPPLVSFIFIHLKKVATFNVSYVVW